MEKILELIKTYLSNNETVGSGIGSNPIIRYGLIGIIVLMGGGFLVNILSDMESLLPESINTTGNSNSIKDQSIEISGKYSGYGSYDPSCECTPKISILITPPSWSGDVLDEEWNTQLPYNVYGTVEGNNLFDQSGNKVGIANGDQLIIDYYGDTQYLDKE